MNNPDRIILHCAATPDEGDKFGSEQINKWHKERGWKDQATGISCGYHYVIRRSGVIESYRSGNLCRPESSMGAHCRGHNTNTLGVCFIGIKEITLEQYNAWMDLYQDILRRWKIPVDNIHGHNEFSSKDCPGFNVHMLCLAMKRELK